MGTANVTALVPEVPLSRYKRTKILATIGPASNSYETILSIIKAGANGLRLNFSHGTYEERDQQIKWIRRASKAYGKPVAIIQDLQGPKLRLGDFDGVVTISRGQRLSFAYKADYSLTGHLPTQYDLSRRVQRGERMLIADGRLHTVITAVRDGVVYAEAENEGMLIKNKGINLPDTDFAGAVLTVKDRADLAYGSSQDIDWVAMSFVQTPEDIELVRRRLRALGSNARIIAKVETKAAVENVEAIMEAADAVMIARGDLGVETLPESVPIVQRQIIGLGLRYGKPTIVATQMLASMVDSPEPTRAEVSDIATAVIVGADCVMLSDETANGRYPVEAVKLMKRVILYTQENTPVRAVFPSEPVPSRQSAISSAIINLASKLEARAIVAETRSGATALNIAARRPVIPIIAVTSDIRTAQQLAIVYGVKSYVRPIDRLAAIKLTNWLQQNKVLKTGDMVVTASGQHPGVVGTTDTIKVRVLE